MPPSQRAYILILISLRIRFHPHPPIPFSSELTFLFAGHVPDRKDSRREGRGAAGERTSASFKWHRSNKIFWSCSPITFGRSQPSPTKAISPSDFLLLHSLRFFPIETVKVGQATTELRVINRSELGRGWEERKSSSLAKHYLECQTTREIPVSADASLLPMLVCSHMKGTGDNGVQ
ncbi:hypothetical protein CDAR_453811 [Caerostris darwini]|uniref:Uncharacterized protein n=1 Tax=Caerostris darwini TaxID=1538125 RepID=A0AAV4UCV5_9ARAC|nr:hypothetical protein CDAR_453811 [Caerostris darwini]